jgi:hypothetical protein
MIGVIACMVHGRWWRAVMEKRAMRVGGTRGGSQVGMTMVVRRVVAVIERRQRVVGSRDLVGVCCLLLGLAPLASKFFKF